MRGEFIDAPTDSAGVDQWCDSEVLRILRRRSLAALRAQIEPVSTAALGRFLPAWQLLGSESVSGVDGLAAVIDQLAGVPLPASAVEPLVFGQRVRDYQPGMLDELLASGEVVWSGAGALSAADGWVAFHPADAAPLSLAPPAGLDLTEVHEAVLAALSGGGAYFFRQISIDGVSTESLERGSVATDLVRICRRRHVRPGAGTAVRSARRRHAAAGHPVAPASSRTTAEPLQHQLGRASRLRPDGGRALVGVARRRDRHHGAGPLPGRPAAGTPRRGHQGRGGRRGGAPAASPRCTRC